MEKEEEKKILLCSEAVRAWKSGITDMADVTNANVCQICGKGFLSEKKD